MGIPSQLHRPNLLLPRICSNLIRHPPVGAAQIATTAVGPAECGWGFGFHRIGALRNDPRFNDLSYVSEDTFVDHCHVSSSISENKCGIVIGVAAAAVAVGGVAYYVTSRARGEADEESLRSRKTRTRRKRSLARRCRTMGPSWRRESQKGPRSRRSLKSFVKEQYYTCAIEVSPHPEPVFYSNCAVCYHEKVVADCNEALKLNAPYVKALNRRATALEALERYEDSLQEKLSKTKAAEILANRESRLVLAEIGPAIQV
ncbi:hypothetical protein EDB85DRAFT_1894645 [Lactarius pseudohatsudake]|nr:hypothetical protein EDB85DRAFT_1894645 [Lactarius pseudohatsudake]